MKGQGNEEVDKEATYTLPLYKCALQWRNRIGMTSRQEYKKNKESNESWNKIVHFRVANYLKLY